MRKVAACTGVLVVLALAACDQVYADPVTAPYSSSGFAPGVDAGGLTTTRTPPVQCPATLDENGPCPQVGAKCEIGTSPDPRCNTEFACANDERYGSYWTERTRGTCTDVCPDPSLIVDGAPCELTDTAPEAELHCTTPQGPCICTTGRDGAHQHARKWVCTKPETGCPLKRPLYGQPCFGERSCDYGACISKRGTRMFCEDDVWQTELATCAD